MTTDTKNKIGVGVFRSGLTSPMALAVVFLLAGWLYLERYIPRVRRQWKDTRSEKRESRGEE